MRDKASFERDFPKLAGSDFSIAGPADDNYNCIAWAIGENRLNCWPIRRVDAYWPRRIPFQETVGAFTQFFKLHHFELCDNASLELGWEKVALYALKGVPKHAVRQLPTGRWTSKMGADEVLEIPDPGVLEGDDYGQVVLYFKRKRPS